MKYVKFFLKCILAALPAIVLIAFTLLCPFCYMDEEYPAWRYSKDVVSGKISGDYDTVILGDSGAMSAIIPEKLSDSCVNIAVGGGTSIEMYYFLKEYLENHRAPKNVIVMYAPFHYFNVDNYETRTMYFKVLSIGDAKELYNFAKTTENKNDIDKEDVFWQEFACRTGLPTKYLPALTKSHFIGRYSDNTGAYNNLINSKGYAPFGTADGCDEKSYECSYSEFDTSGNVTLLTKYLFNIVGLCYSNNINLYVIQPALNEASYNGLSVGYASGYKAYMQSVAFNASIATVETELRCYDNKYFGDVSHLNRKGAEKFTEEIKQKYPEIFEKR